MRKIREERKYSESYTKGNMSKERKDINNQYQWALSKMHTAESWIKQHDEVGKLAKAFVQYQGKLTKDADTLLAALDAQSEIRMKLSDLMAFAQMKQDEDSSVASSIVRSDQAQRLYADVSATMAFVKPELLSVKYDDIKAFLEKNPGLKKYEFTLYELFRYEKHTLSETEEKLLSQVNPIFEASYDTFGMLSNLDMQFGTVKMPDGKELPLTNGSYGTFMVSKDREVRKQAYEGLLGEIRAHKNTIATTLGYSVKTDVLKAKLKKYDSALEKVLYPDNVPVSLYKNLIEVVNKYVPVLQHYLELRRKMLKLDKLHMYDMYVPLFEIENEIIPYQKGLDIMRAALAPLGEEYLNHMNRGIEDGWIDVYENKGKRSGAYSYGSYMSMPYILLNYDNTNRDVFTLVHEMGHSMHSLYARKTQPYHYAEYSLFVAEVASTVNEGLLAHYFLQNAKDDQEKLYHINMYLEGFRATIFRQTMFAEFELLIHEAVEKGETLTVDFLCEQYLNINRKYFGDNVELDDYISVEWARVPHFYHSFYVYKYATGYSAATAITQKILKEGKPAVENYIDFLKCGGSKYPVDALQIAGVDMSQTEPIESAMKRFGELLNQMEEILK